MKIYCSQEPELSKAPWYLKQFMVFKYVDRSLEIGFTVPFKFWGEIFWYKFPRWILNRQMSKCVNYFPDYAGGFGPKVKPFLGYVLIIEEGASMSWKWWNYLKKYKQN